MGRDDDDDRSGFLHHKSNQYDVNSKIMLAAIVSLSVVVLFVAILHFYGRFVLRRRAARRRREASLSGNINFLIANNHASQIHSVSELPKTGLDPSVIASLPTFAYKQGEMDPIECTVCLSLLEEAEVARTLPNCKHIFHADCIDKWFGIHSSCPICRTEAEPRLLMMPEPREGLAPPSAPPLDRANSTLARTEGPPSTSSSESTTACTQSSSAKNMGGGSSSTSRLSSFRRILSRERSSRRIQLLSSGQDNNDGNVDLERQ